MSRARFLPPMPVEKWPPHYVEAWRRALEDNPLSPGGRGGGAWWRPATVRSYAIAVGVWLTWLDRRGRLTAETRPDAFVTPDMLREYLADMHWAELSEHSAAGRVGSLGSALRAMAPNLDTAFLGRAAGRIRQDAPRVRDVYAEVRTPAEILRLGRELMAQADGVTLCDVDRALAFRDGLLLSAIIHRPLRIKNFSSIALDRHVVRKGAGFRWCFDASEMKAGKPFSCVFPKDLCPAMERYLAEFRPLLLGHRPSGSATANLWVGIHGQPLLPEAVTAILRRRVNAAFGKGIGPHILRHIMSTMMAECAPTQVAAVSIILGHQSVGTSERHYVHAGAMEAGRQLHAILAARRNKGLR